MAKRTYMNSLQEYVRNNFDGILVISDVHSDYASFMRAYEFAKSEHFFFMSIGDLVDRGRYPFETVKAMAEIIDNGFGGLCIGNHDDKFVRYARGAKVSFSLDAKQTLVDVGPEREADFLQTYVKMVEDAPFSADFHKFDNITLVHAASHPAMWENHTTVSKSVRSRYIVGETTGKMDRDGKPERLYNWIEEIPFGKTVIVGHDCQPIYNVSIVEPLLVSNKNGGKAVFIDTGNGKGGFLTAAVIMVDKNKFNIESYVDFKKAVIS